MTGSFTGPAGHAERYDFDRTPEWAALTVTMWLVTAPGWSPAWDQYTIGVVRLDDRDGWPPAHRQFPTATHELFIAALDPAGAPYDTAGLDFYAATGSLPYLSPINAALQFEGTDPELEQLAEYVAYAITGGVLPPQPVLGYDGFRQAWQVSLDKTLAHLRGHHDHPRE